MPSSSAFPFERLPLELIEEVVEQLCLHCTPLKVLHDREDEASYRPYVASLASLCLTSKSLNSIAIRHLYHRPDCQKWWLLARTLINRKDLSQHVKYLYCLDWEDFFPPLGEPDDTLDPLNKMRLLEHTDAIGDEARAILRDANTDASVEIMCALCPNLETLVVTEQYWRDEAPLLPCLLPDSMPHLRHLDVSASYREGFQVGICAALFRAAPNLTSLRFDAPVYCDDLQLTLSHVTRVDLVWSRLDVESLGNLVRACPRLERLRYESCAPKGVEPRLTPREAKEMILKHAPNIKRFDLVVFRSHSTPGPRVYMEQSTDILTTLE